MEDASTFVLGWAWLPIHLLDLILEKLIPISDYIRFSAVCKHWQSVALHQKQHRLKSQHKQLPMLMFLSKNNNNQRRRLFSVTQRKTFGFELYVPQYMRCYGSFQGWLVCVNSMDERLLVTLINPFSGRTISLPSVADEPYVILKAALSANPSQLPNDYEVVVIYKTYTRRIAHFKSGDDAWTQIAQRYDYSDLIYFKNQFLVVIWDGAVFSITVSSDQATKPQVRIVVLREPCTRNKTYLVESSRGDLLLVRKFEQIDGYKHFTVTLSFKVYKLSCTYEDKPHWVETESLENDALFLGDSQSMCVSALDFLGCHPNSIYFTDECFGVAHGEAQRPHGMATFKLENERLRTILYYTSGGPPSFWITPSLM